MKDEEILVTVKEVISEELNVNLEKVREDSHLKNDLGADSLDMTRTIMELEDRFNIEIPMENFYMKEPTVSLVLAVVKNLLNSD